MLDALLEEEPERAGMDWPEGFEGGIAHRLDLSTSGALWVADNPEELAQMRRWFAEKCLRKTYRLLAAKDPGWDQNTCDRPLAHDKRKKSKMVVQRGAKTPHRGKWLEAHTQFRRVRGQVFEAQMRTGVMHQIRCHAAFVGIPLLGDRRYGGGDPPMEAPEGVQFFLHHVGLVGPDGTGTAPVELPSWAT